MKITKVEEQALRLVIGLARREGRCTLGELARQEGMSVALTAKILGKLRRGKVVRATRGRHGHYVLAAEPSRTTVASVLRAIEPTVLRGCFNAASGRCQCPHGSDCSLRPIWHHVEQKVERVLEQLTLADLLHEEKLVRQQVGAL